MSDTFLGSKDIAMNEREKTPVLIGGDKQKVSDNCYRVMWQWLAGYFGLEV